LARLEVRSANRSRSRATSGGQDAHAAGPRTAASWPQSSAAASPRPSRGSPPDRPRSTAQLRGLAAELLVQLPFGGALEDPGDLGQQVGSACRELAQRGHRGAVLGGRKLAPPRVMHRRAVQFRHGDPVSLRPLIDHAF